MAINSLLSIKEAITQIEGFKLSLQLLKKPYEAIGEQLKTSTSIRYNLEIDPNGVRWAPNADSTILAYMHKQTGGRHLSRTKTAHGGRTVTKQGMVALANKKILRDTGTLQDTMIYEATDGYLMFGANPSTSVYAADMQFGVPSRSIPARPFIGFTNDDATAVQSILESYIKTKWMSFTS